MASDTPSSHDELASRTPSPRDEPQETQSASGHLSESIEIKRWLALLIILATLLALVLVLAVTVRLLSFIGHTVLIFALGGLLAYALDPLVERLRGPARPEGKRRSRASSALLVFLMIFAVIGVMVVSLSQTMTRQVEILAHEHDKYEAQLRNRLTHTDEGLAARGIHIHLSSYLDHPPPNVKTWGEALANSALRILEHLARDIVEAVLVVIITLYLLIYSEEMRERANRHLPPRLLSYALQWQSDVNRILGGFVRGQAVLAITIGVMAALLCLGMGLRLWLLIGLFVMVAALVPVVGPIVGAVPAIIAALISPHAHFSPAVRVVVLIVCFVLINEFGSKILYPRLVGSALGLNETLALFALLAGYDVGGLVGVLFAAPLTALSIVTFAQLFRFWQGLPPAPLAQPLRPTERKT